MHEKNSGTHSTKTEKVIFTITKLITKNMLQKLFLGANTIVYS